MQRLKLGFFQTLVAVVCIAVWHLATTILGRTESRCFRRSSFQRRVMSPRVFSSGSAEGTIWRHLWITLSGIDAGIRRGLCRGRADRLLVCAPATDRGDFRSLRENGECVAAHRARPNFHAVVRARHLVEGGARHHAGVLHRVFQRLSRRQGSQPHGAGQCPHARNERAAADAPCLLAVGYVVDVLIAAHLASVLLWSVRWWANISVPRAGLGYLILQAEGTFDIAGVFAGMFVLAAFVLVIDAIVTMVERRLLVWRPVQADGRT